MSSTEPPGPPGPPAPPTGPPAAGWGYPPPAGQPVPGPAGGAAPGWPVTPPRAKGSLTWLWVTLAALAVAGVLAVVGAIAFTNSVRDPIDSMHSFLRAVEGSRYDDAFDRLCSAEQDSVGREDFPLAISDFAADLDTWTVYTFDPSGDERKVIFEVTDFDGDSTRYEAVMVLESDEWRVCDLFS